MKSREKQRKKGERKTQREKIRKIYRYIGDEIK